MQRKRSFNLKTISIEQDFHLQTFLNITLFLKVQTLYVWLIILFITLILHWGYYKISYDYKQQLLVDFLFSSQPSPIAKEISVDRYITNYSILDIITG